MDDLRIIRYVLGAFAERQLADIMRAPVETIHDWLHKSKRIPSRRKQEFCRKMIAEMEKQDKIRADIKLELAETIRKLGNETGPYLALAGIFVGTYQTAVVYLYCCSTFSIDILTNSLLLST